MKRGSQDYSSYKNDTYEEGGITERGLIQTQTHLLDTLHPEQNDRKPSISIRTQEPSPVHQEDIIDNDFMKTNAQKKEETKQPDLNQNEEEKEEEEEDEEGVGQSTIKTAQNMQESNTLRKIMYDSAQRCCLLNVFIIAMCMIDSELRWSHRDDYDEFFFNQYAHYSFYFLNTTRTLALLASIFTLRQTYVWHQANIKKLKQRNKLSQSIAFPRRFLFKFIIEIVICSVHIPPFVDTHLIHFNEKQFLDYLTMASFLKLYVFIRLMKEKSPLNSNSGRFIGSFTNIEFTDLFYIKTWLKDNPFQAMLFAVGALLISCSYLLYLAERVHPVDCSNISGKFSTYLNALWLVIVTVFTVGYGDIVPQTDLGRAIAIIAALCGLILSATLIGLVHQYLTLNNDEANILKFIAEHQRIKIYQESALDCIMQAIRIYALKSIKRRSHRKIRQAMTDLDEKINYFRSLRSKAPDKFAAKGALSTIEYQVNIAYSTLKIISDYLQNKRILILDSSQQAKKLLLETSGNFKGNLSVKNSQFNKSHQDIVTPKSNVEIQTEPMQDQVIKFYCENCKQCMTKSQQDSNKDSPTSIEKVIYNTPIDLQEQPQHESQQISSGERDNRQAGGTLQEIKELREIVYQRREDIDRVFSKMRDIEDKMNQIMNELMEL